MLLDKPSLYFLVLKCFRENVMLRRMLHIQNSVHPVDLKYLVFGKNKGSSLRPVVMLHGFLGSKVNWRYFAKKISNDFNCQVFTIDARNHGCSPHSEISNYSAMSDDLKGFLNKHNLEKPILIGHSMGGRTGMILSTKHPNMVDKLIVVDISPFSSPDNVLPTLDKIFPVLRSFLSNLPPNTSLPEARQLCQSSLPKDIPDIGLVDAILFNLKEDTNGKITWTANVNMDYQSIVKPMTIFGTYDGPTYFLCGKNSPYVKPDEHTLICKNFPHATFHYIEGAGHVVNLDNPIEFQKKLYECLRYQ